MAPFHPKEVFQKAREAEREGKMKEAATHYASLSMFLRKRGKNEEALTLIRRAIALSPGFIRFHLQLALCAELNGDAAAAEGAMRYFTENVIERGKADSQRAIVESLLKTQPRLRQIFFDRVLQLDKTNSMPFLGRAKSLREQKDVEGALRVLIEALQAGTDREEVMDELDATLRALGKSEARVHFERFKEGKISSENFVVLLKGETRSERSGSHSVTALTQEKPLRDLIEELEKEIGPSVTSPQSEIEPLLEEFRRRSQPILGKDASARMDMALAFFEMGLQQEALEELGAIDETDRRYAESRALLGEFHLTSGSYLAALDAFQVCLRTPGCSKEVEREARYKLIQVFYRLGDLKNAFSHAAELEKLAPDYRDLRLLKHQIQEAMSSWNPG